MSPLWKKKLKKRARREIGTENLIIQKQERELVFLRIRDKMNAPGLQSDGKNSNFGEWDTISIVGHRKRAGFKFKKKWHPLRTLHHRSEIY